MSLRFACGSLLLGAFILGLLGWFVFQIVWLTLGAFAIMIVAGAMFFFLCLEE